MTDTPRLVGHRLSARERRHWRLVVAAVAACVLLVAYSLPMFPNRITAAVTRYSGGTTISAFFPELVLDQHLKLGQRPLNEEFQDVQITVAPVEGHRGSGWVWLSAAVRSHTFVRLASLLVCLLVPVLSSLLALCLVGRAWSSDRGLPEAFIPPSISLAAMAIPALVLAWFHQFDFSTLLLSKATAALMPSIGFWVALVALIASFIALVGLRHETRREIINWWALVWAVALTLWLLIRLRPYPFWMIWSFVADGILVTLRIVATSFGLILLVSLLGGLGRISRSPIIYGAASLYVELVRGIPLMVQLLFIWFALPQVFDVVGNALVNSSGGLASVGQWFLDLRLDPFTAAVMGLTVCYGAYGSEIFRAGISSIHAGQMEAARSLGMTYFQAMRYVILPQAVRVILPPIGNEFVALLKDSSLVSVLAVSDLTRRGREYMARTFQSFDTWILVALCYLVLTLFSSRAVEYIEAKTKAVR